MNFTPGEILAAFLGGGGIIGGVITALSFLSGRLEARRKRIEEKSKSALEKEVDVRRLENEIQYKGTDALVNNLWKLIEEQKIELKAKEAVIEEMEADEKLTRPAVMKIYECVRKIRNEMDSLNIMLLSDEETNVFARRWGNIKVIMCELEETLAKG